MPCLITALTRSHTINKTKGEKIYNKISERKKNIFFLAKIQHLNLNAPINNVEIESQKTKQHKFTFSLLQSRWDFTTNICKPNTCKRFENH